MGKVYGKKLRNETMSRSRAAYAMKGDHGAVTSSKNFTLETLKGQLSKPPQDNNRAPLIGSNKQIDLATKNIQKSQIMMIDVSLSLRMQIAEIQLEGCLPTLIKRLDPIDQLAS